MTAHPVQLDLFDPPAALSAPTSAPVRRKGTFPTPPRRRKAAGGAPAARCPVTGGSTCYRAGCHHYRAAGDGAGGHPVALVAAEPPARKPRRKRRP